jgi:UDP:flavonoid glycosyltransferase YjiC (YdhE family)
MVTVRLRELWPLGGRAGQDDGDVQPHYSEVIGAVKLVVTCQPAVGHFHAVAPLALAAERAGHEVLVLTGRGMAPWVRRSGLAVREVGPEWMAAGPRTGSFDDPRRRHRLMSMAAAALVPGMLEAMREIRPDVVLHDSLEWSAPLAADAAGIPYAALGQLPRLPRALVAEVMTQSWGLAREKLGLPPDPGLTRLFPYLYLDAYLPSMQPLSDDPLLWFGGRSEDRVVHQISPPLYQVGAGELPARLRPEPGRPLVYVTMGTAFNQYPALFRAIHDGLRDTEFTVLMTVGSGGDTDAFPHAPNIHVTDYVPQSAVLPFADVVVQHSGYLTIAGSLRHGLPMVLLPVAVDQPYHAHRLTAAGVALRLEASTVTPDEIITAVRTTFTDPLYRGNAQRLQRELLDLPPVERGVDLLEELARTREPVAA